MSTTKADTAYQLRRVVNFLQGLSDAADAIEAIGSMEGATKEAQAARAEAEAGRDSAVAELATLREEINAAAWNAKIDADVKLAEVADALKAATAQAESVMASAKAAAAAREAEAKQALSDAKVQAEELVADAVSQADAVTADLAEKAEQLNALAAQLAEAKALIAKADRARAALSEV